MGIVTPFPTARIIAGGGPVSRALRAMRAMSPEEQQTIIPRLREQIEIEIEAGIALLDLIDGDADDEPSLASCNRIDQTAYCVGDGSDREEGDDNGIADDDGMCWVNGDTVSAGVQP